MTEFCAHGTSSTEAIERQPNIASAIELAKDSTTGDPVAEVVDRVFCFAAGTLVHTSKGLVPIEDICIGDMVLSQPEHGGEQAYKRVLSTVVYEDKPVMLLSYVQIDETTPYHLIVTGNHPFWVPEKGWIRADRLTSGARVLLHDGREGMVFLNRYIFKTDVEGIGWTCIESLEDGTAVDFRGDRIVIDDKPSFISSAFENLGVVHQAVYNFEVEGCHTYYAGELGVWTHNIKCGAPMGHREGQESGAHQ